MLAGLELFGELEFAFGVFGASEIAVGLAEKVVGDVVVGIHGNGALQGADGELGFAFFLQNFAEKNVRTGAGGVEPNGPLKKFFGLVIFLQAGIGVGKFVVGDGIPGIEHEFLFELSGGFGNFGLVKIEFTEELVGEGKLGV